MRLGACYNPGMSNLPPVIAIKDANVGTHRRLDFARGATATLTADAVEVLINPKNTVTVGPDGADFDTLAEASSWIDAQADAAEDNPYLILIGPGVFNIGFQILAPYISVRGSGVDITILDGAMEVSHKQSVSHLSFNCAVNLTNFCIYCYGGDDIVIHDISVTYNNNVSYINGLANIDLGSPGGAYGTGKRNRIYNCRADSNSCCLFLSDGTGLGYDANTQVYNCNFRAVDHTTFPSWTNVGVISSNVSVDISNCKLYSEVPIYPVAFYTPSIGVPYTVAGDIFIRGCNLDSGGLGVGVFIESDTSIQITGTIMEPFDLGSLTTIEPSGDWSWPSGGTFDLTGSLEVKEIPTPSTPAPGYIRMYGKSDGCLYQIDDAGTETNLIRPGIDDVLTLSDSSVVVLRSTGNVVTLS